MPAARVPERLHRRSLIAPGPMAPAVRHAASACVISRRTRINVRSAHTKQQGPAGPKTPPDLVYSYRNDWTRFARSDSVNRNRC
jgi:hypothetical protein